MSMDEQLLQELYGSETTQAEEEIKLAQVELVEAVAAESGVDLNELDDQELAKFAEYVLSDEDELVDEEEAYAQEKLAEADMMGRQMARSYIDELSEIQGDTDMDYEDNTQVKIASAMQDVAEAWEMQKLAEEDNAGRNAAMAGLGAGALAGGAAYGARAYGRRALQKHDDAFLAYGQERAKGLKKLLTSAGEKTDSKGKKFRTGSIEGRLAMAKKKLEQNRQAQATGRKHFGGSAKANARLQQRGAKLENIIGRVQQQKADAIKKYESGAEHLKKLDTMRKARAEEAGSFRRHLRGLSGAQMAGIGAGAAALGAGGAYLMSRKKKQQKKTAALLDYGYEALAIADLYGPEEFAKEAELRAAEILAANGVHPETFEEIQPEEIKLASFPGVEDAIDNDEAEALLEYNEMLDTAALHIIDELFE